MSGQGPTPKTNGKAECFIQTALREWAYAEAQPNSDHRAAELPVWLHRYNWHRPHGSLKGSSSLCVIHRLLATMSLWAGMQKKSKWSPGPGVKILGVTLTVDEGWVVSATGSAIGICPDCGQRSRSRHGWARRNLQDLPVQGKPVTVKLLLSRWRCAHRECLRRTFTDRLPTVADPYASDEKGRRDCRPVRP